MWPYSLQSWPRFLLPRVSHEGTWPSDVPQMPSCHPGSVHSAWDRPRYRGRPLRTSWWSHVTDQRNGSMFTMYVRPLHSLSLCSRARSWRVVLPFNMHAVDHFSLASAKKSFSRDEKRKRLISQHNIYTYNIYIYACVVVCVCVGEWVGEWMCERATLTLIPVLYLSFFSPFFLINVLIWES